MKESWLKFGAWRVFICLVFFVCFMFVYVCLWCLCLCLFFVYVWFMFGLCLFVFIVLTFLNLSIKTTGPDFWNDWFVNSFFFGANCSAALRFILKLNAASSPCFFFFFFFVFCFMCLFIILINYYRPFINYYLFHYFLHFYL